MHFRIERRIVDDDHVLLLRLVGEAVGVVVERGRLADEEAVVFGELGVVVLADRVDFDAELGAGVDEALQRALVRRRHRIVDVGQHREIEAELAALARLAPELLGELVERLRERVFLRIGQRVQAGRLDRADLPDALALELDAQDRARKRLEHLARDVLEALRRGLAEVEQHAEIGRVAAAVGQELLQLLVEIVDVEAVQRAAAQIVDRAHRRNHLVPARLGQQRNVVAGAEILVAAAEVDDLRALVVGADRLLEVILRGDDVVGRVVRTPVRGFLDDDDEATHARRSAGDGSVAAVRGGGGVRWSAWARRAV